MPRHRSPRKFLKASKFLLPILFAVLLFASLVVVNDFLKVKKVTIIVSDKKVKINGLETFIGKNIVFISPEESRQFLYSRNSYIEDVEITKKYPSELLISLTVYEERAQLEALDGFYVISSSGRILRKTGARSSALLPVTYYQRLSPYSYQVGDTVSYKDIQYALRFMTILDEEGFPALSVAISSSNMIAFTLRDKKIYFTAKREYDIQEYQLKTIIRQLKIEGKDFEFLDLRFEKPVIKFK